MTTPRRPGDPVRVVAPGNTRLHGSTAVVMTVEPWGYLLFAPAAATGRFRALPCEVESVGPELLASSPTGEIDDAPAPRRVPYTPPGNEGRVETADDTPEDLVYVPPERRQAPRADGVGEPCVNCGGLNLRRTGPCLTCQDCGSNSGCG
jgi:hypothetical protein